MKIAVTGLSGMVGTRLKQLYQDKHEFSNLDLTVGVDITNADMVRDFMRQTDCETIIHLAAYTNLNEANKQDNDLSGACYRVNVIGTQNIVDSADECGKYLIHVSTDYVFDGNKTEPYSEDDIPNPIEWYGKTKLTAETYVKQSSGRHVIARLAFPYQANPSRPDLVAIMREKLAANTLYPVFTDHYITPTFTDDFARALVRMAEIRPTGIYHVTGSSYHSDFEIASMINKIFSLDGEVKAGSLDAYLQSNPRPYQRSLKISNHKLRQNLGIIMSTLEEGLGEING